MNSGKSSMQSEIVVLKIYDITYVPVKNVAKNTMVTIHAVIDTVLCVRAMLEKNGFKKNLAIY